MTEENRPAGTAGFDELQRAWKNTRAPAGLAEKVMASIEDASLPSRTRGLKWSLGWSGAAAVILAGVIISVVGRHPAEPTSPSISLPSLSLAAINRAAGGKPSFSIPGPGNLKSIPEPPNIPSSIPNEIPEPTTLLHEEYDDEISDQTWIV